MPFPTPGYSKIVIEPFAPEIGNGTWGDHCVDHRADVDLHVQIDVQTGATSRIYHWNSKDDYAFLEIAWGCLPPGTNITLDGGAELAIEDIEIGDRVMTDDDGGVLTVVDIMEGLEADPLVIIEDSMGHIVPMTATHPVPTLDSGLLEARELAVGHRIETEGGVAYIVDVTREEYDGEVYNLILGTPAELEALGEETTMMANHVVVGDARMQKALKLERSAQADAARAQTPVPPELYVDYLGFHVRSVVRQLQN